MEYLDIVDENNELTGKTEERNIIHEKGIWHREVAVWIMNEKGEILLQKRATTKKQEPNMWATCAGHVESEIKYIPFKEFDKMIENKDKNVTFVKQYYMPELVEILRTRM